LLLTIVSEKEVILNCFEVLFRNLPGWGAGGGGRIPTNLFEVMEFGVLNVVLLNIRFFATLGNICLDTQRNI
jgi:hypothetical protein